MLKRPVTSDELARLRDERDAADRAYNEALTALDRALPRFDAAVAATAAYDDSQVAPTQRVAGRSSTHTSLPARRGLRSRLAHFVWRLVAPVFERQQAFNSTLVDHLNRQRRSRARRRTRARAPDRACSPHTRRRSRRFSRT